MSQARSDRVTLTRPDPREVTRPVKCPGETPHAITQLEGRAIALPKKRLLVVQFGLITTNCDSWYKRVVYHSHSKSM